MILTIICKQNKQNQFSSIEVLKSKRKPEKHYLEHPQWKHLKFQLFISHLKYWSCCKTNQLRIQMEISICCSQTFVCVFFVEAKINKVNCVWKTLTKEMLIAKALRIWCFHFVKIKKLGTWHNFIRLNYFEQRNFEGSQNLKKIQKYPGQKSLVLKMNRWYQ